MAEPVRDSRVELVPPDLSRWQAGNVGVAGVHVFDSGRPGANVLVQALTHGNEICGAIALDALLDEGVTVRRGRLTLIFANLAAYERFDPADPDASRFVDEDLNRVWSDEVLSGPRDSTELRRARELKPFVDAADRLLDIHSMSGPCRPLMVCGQVDKNAAYARQLGVPADVLLDTGHPSGLRMIERGGFGDPASPQRALLIECGQHWERSAAAVATDTLMRFLALTGVVDAGWALSRCPLRPPATQRVVRVTEAVVARSEDFRFLLPLEGLGVIPKAQTPIAQDGDQVWTTPYDNAVMVMPSATPPQPGATQLRIGRWVAHP